MLKNLLIVALLLWPLCANAGAQDDLAQGFHTPPAEAKPRVYWWWLNSQVTKEAITRDLEEMKAKGIGGALLFDAGTPAGPVPAGPAFLSDPWRGLFRHAVREADRLGLELSVNLCSGWDCGGPWIEPENACRRLASSQLIRTGPERFADALPRPVGEDFRDIAVLAIPVLAGQKQFPTPRVTASSAQSNHPIQNVIDRDSSTFWVSDGWKPGDGPSEDKPQWLCFEFAEPVDLSVVQLVTRPGYGPHRVQVQVPGQDQTFHTVATHTFADPAESRPALIRFSEITTRQIRLLITSAYTDGSTDLPWNVQISDVGFDESSLSWDNWAVKAAVTSTGYRRGTGPSYVDALESAADDNADNSISRDAVVDLTDRLDVEGRLQWDVPPGRWRIIRLGHVAAGYRTSSSSAGGGGLEVDWLSSKAMEAHFAATAEKLLEDAGPLAGSALKYFHDDSWEVGVPNWTDEFEEVFRRNRGYDPKPYLPILAGHAIEGREVSERFLYDYRKTLADCLADNHYGRFRDLCHARGVLMHTEGGGPCTQIAPMDALRNLGMNDVPMGEFWQYEEWTDGGQNMVGKQTASAAHIYGKQFAAAEAFTSMQRPHWQEGPAEMKPIADLAFCEGINRFFHHTFTCSPQEFGIPGIEYFAGTHFNPNITWWQQAGALELYIARCQFLLSRGLFVADVCYYYGDQAPNFVGPRHVGMSLGDGYDYDVCNADVLLNAMQVRDGRIVLPDGMSYRMLVLPNRKTMPVEVLNKVKQLVAAGATVVGPRPQRAPGLRDFPDCDDQVRELADPLWGDCDGQTVFEHAYGDGRINCGCEEREVLQQMNVPPDFEYQAAQEGARLDYIHRVLDRAEIYFVANRLNESVQADCIFRVSQRQPELWDPVSGRIAEAGAFTQDNGRTRIPLQLAPHESMFVVFRRPIDADTSGEGDRNWTAYGDPHELTGPWTVRFDPKWGGPESVAFEQLTDWTERPEPGIRYYSGTATYTKTFDLPERIAGLGRNVVLELGVVNNVAQVRLNGQELGTVWTAPWRVVLGDALRPTGNALEIKVVNLWPNRLIGDAGLPAEERFTRTNVSSFDFGGRVPITADAPLLSSGLLGPVTLRASDGTSGN